MEKTSLFYKIGCWMIRNKKTILRLPLGIPVLILLAPIVWEIATLNLFFLREWIQNNTYHTATFLQLFLGPDRMFLWLHVIAGGLMLLIGILVLKMGLWNRIFPILVLKDQQSYRQENRVYWYPDNIFERLWKRVCQKKGIECLKRQPRIIVSSGLISPIDPMKNMITIRIPDKALILERKPKELVVQDTGVMQRHKEGEWEMTWKRNNNNKVDSYDIISRVSHLLTVMTDETSKSAKADPHIRKKVVMDSTYTQSSSIAPQIKRLVKQIREEREDG